MPMRLARKRRTTKNRKRTVLQSFLVRRNLKGAMAMGLGVSEGEESEDDDEPPRERVKGKSN